MVAIPENKETTANKIDAWHKEAQSQLPRAHLGASIIGNECERALWYSFRWVTRVQHEGRLLRLFRRGHDEENYFVADLRRIGVEVLETNPETGKQWQYSALGGHFGGSCDGLCINVPEAPKTPHIAEFKTHAEKSFNDLKKKGVQESKPVHYSQMQVYMHLQGFDRALYLAVNKNNDELYSERIKYDEAAANALFAKAERIVKSINPPAGISADPSFYLCRFCDHQETCHGEKTAAMSCRTCVSATPQLDGEARWSCDLIASDVDYKAQVKGCERHLFLPELVPMGEFVEYDQETRAIVYNCKSVNKPFRNGPPGDSSYPSKELQHITPNFIGDFGLECLREEFGAELIGVEKISDNETHFEYEQPEPRQCGPASIVGWVMVKPVAIPNDQGDHVEKYGVYRGTKRLHDGFFECKDKAIEFAKGCD